MRCEDGKMKVLTLPHASNVSSVQSVPGYVDSNPAGASTYSASVECSFLVIAPRYTYVRLKFDQFQLESGSGCPYDSLKVCE